MEEEEEHEKPRSGEMKVEKKKLNPLCAEPEQLKYTMIRMSLLSGSTEMRPLRERELTKSVQ